MLSELQDQLHPYLVWFGDNIWVQASVMLVATLLLSSIFNHAVIGGLRAIANRTRFALDDSLIDYLHKPVYYTLILIGLAITANLLQLGDTLRFIVTSALLSIGYLVWAVFVLRLIRSLLRVVSGTERRIKMLHPQTLPLFENLAMIVIIVVAVYVVFTAWDIDMTAWLASAGIVGIAVGFAAKDTLANLFSGVFILADAPYKIGDYVVLESGERGEITHIGIRSTRMRTRDDVEVTVPNAIMGNTKIINESGGPSPKYRVRVKVGVAYGSDIDQIDAILMDIANNNPQVCADPAARVRFRAFGASSLDFELLVWVEHPSLRGSITHELLGATYKRFRADGIEIPYSKHDLYIKELPSRN